MEPSHTIAPWKHLAGNAPKMEGEDESFRLTEAELLAKLATNSYRMKALGIAPPSDIAKTKASGR
jgi:hypothetical protein